MFLVQCYNDSLAYVVDIDVDVQCRGKEVHEIMEEDEIIFTMNKKQYEGKVIVYSSHSQYLKNEKKQFNKSIMETKSQKTNDVSITKSKRKPIPKRSWSPSDPPSPKKQKKDNKIKKKNVQSKSSVKKTQSKEEVDTSGTSDSSQISEDNETKENYKKPACSISPSKEDLKIRLAVLMAEKAKYESTEDSSTKLTSKTGNVLTPQNKSSVDGPKNKIPPELVSQKEDDELSAKLPPVCGNKANNDVNQNVISPQLFSSDFEDRKMTNIGSDIYCRNVIYNSAIGASRRATHLARRLLEGVFTHESLMDSTLTGQAPRGKDKKVTTVTPLDQRAKNAIVDFAMCYAKEHGWPPQDRSKILKEMSQKLTEYKRNHNNDKKQQN